MPLKSARSVVRFRDFSYLLAAFSLKAVVLPLPNAGPFDTLPHVAVAPDHKVIFIAS